MTGLLFQHTIFQLMHLILLGIPNIFYHREDLPILTISNWVIVLQRSNYLCVHQHSNLSVMTHEQTMTSSQFLVILFYLRQKPKAKIHSPLDMQTWPWNASTLA